MKPSPLAAVAIAWIESQYGSLKRHPEACRAVGLSTRMDEIAAAIVKQVEEHGAFSLGEHASMAARFEASANCIMAVCASLTSDRAGCLRQSYVDADGSEVDPSSVSDLIADCAGKNGVSGERIQQAQKRMKEIEVRWVIATPPPTTAPGVG